MREEKELLPKGQPFTMPTPLHVTVDEDYPFLPKGIAFKLSSLLLRAVALPILHLFCIVFFGFRIQGKENRRKVKGCAISILNHVHPLDCAMACIALQPASVYFPTLKSNLEIPFIRFLIKLLLGLPIPQTPHAFMAFSRAIREVLDSGDTVHLYPEGALYPYDNHLRPFKRGAFRFAVQFGAPILPMVLTYRKPRGLGRLLRRKRPYLTLEILPPQYPPMDGDERSRVRVLTQACRSAMEQRFQQRLREQGYRAEE